MGDLLYLFKYKKMKKNNCNVENILHQNYLHLMIPVILRQSDMELKNYN
ncbi:unnamed protein product [Tenebrio molitor]|nr:unnamed protein product [Tenebrio molitor]